MNNELLEACKKEYDHQMVKYISGHLPALTAYLSDTNYQYRLEEDPAQDCVYVEYYCAMEGHRYTQLFRVRGGQLDVLSDIIDTVRSVE